MSTSLVTIDQLPPAQTTTAVSIVQRIPTLSSVLPASVDRRLWLSAAVIECNQLPADINAGTAVTSCLSAAYLGLMFGKQLGHAHIVTFKKNAQLIIGYQGLLHLAYGTGYLATAQAFVVTRGERFEHWVDELGSHVKHVPNLDVVPTRENVQCAYCIYQTVNGQRDVVVIPRSRIDVADKHRDVWNSNYGSMVRKTAIIASAKTWNKTAQLSHAIMIDEQLERDELQSPPPQTIIAPATGAAVQPTDFVDDDAEFNAAINAEK